MSKRITKERMTDLLTEEDYLDMERSSEIKHEYFNGEIFSMTGASRKHNLIVANVIVALGIQLKGKPCRIYPSDMKLKIKATGLYTYPDVMVICNEELFTDDKQDTVLNPDVIIEVLSDSTEKYDRGTKFNHYKKLDSLKEYILISQHQQKIEKFFRTEKRNWMYSETDEEHPVITIESIDCNLNHLEVYDKISE